MSPGTPILEEGRNCWRRVRTRRLAFLIDAAAYFRAFKAAALKARRSILIVAWDVNSRTALEFPETAMPDVPNALGPFLNHIAGRADGPEIRVLDWDSPIFYGMDREWLPQARFDWFTHPRLRFALDREHPIGASQHQKLVIIDDRLAFLGGLDLTLGRLDDSGHRPGDPRRRNPDGEAYGPYHDVQVAVEGEAAQAIAEIARERWFMVTGERLGAAESSADPWPDGLAPDVRDVEVGLARTWPAWKGRRAAREVEALFLDSIAAARTVIYIENQYFSSNRVAAALIRRLQEPDGPEIVLVLPQGSLGWLEDTAMGLRRRRILAQVRAADSAGRFAVYAPVVGDDADVAVKVHAKVMVVDERFLHIGSANLNNRSMGLDSECDLALDGVDQPGCRDAIVTLRNRLVAEHLGLEPDAVAREIAQARSLIGAIEALRGPGRSLVPLEEEPPQHIDAVLAETELLDPDAPAEPERIAEDLIADDGQREVRRSLLKFGAVVLGLVALTVLWRWGPLAEAVDPASLEDWGRSLEASSFGTAGVILLFAGGSLLMIPVMALIVAVGIIYGPITGLVVAGVGSLLGATAGYGIGALLGREAVRGIMGRRLDRLSRQLARRGILSVTVIRLLPLAPFTLINLAAGASHIRFRDFTLGTVFGMAPGVVALTLLAGQVGRILRSPDPENALGLAVLVAVMAVAGVWVWRRFVRTRGATEPAGTGRREPTQ